MTNGQKLLLIGLVALFVIVRLPGVAIPYQQDEMKTAVAVESGLAGANQFLTHPPLTAILFRADAIIFGTDNMRVMPLVFGLISAILLFIVVKKRFNDRTALWSVFLYAISFYGIWSSLMLDTDGAILPAVFLAAFYCYDRARENGPKTRLWLILAILVLALGLLIKLSFVLVMATFVADFLCENRKRFSAAQLVRTGIVGLCAVVLIGLVFLLYQKINPAFSIGNMLAHAMYYAHLTGRNYLQIVIQTVKAVFYISPLVLAPLFFVSRDIMKRMAPFVWYLGFGFVFYFVIFDFSRGALDKYLMFTIVPLCAISSAVIANVFENTFSIRRNILVAALLTAGAMITLAFVSADALSLYPKTLWFSRVLHGNWAILTPFNGGSGPVGFYVSFLVIAAGFLIAGVAVIFGRIRKSFLTIAMFIIIVAGAIYNGVFMEEFSFGGLYGDTAGVLDASLAYIAANDDITSVDTHNDIGAYELKRIGKYGSHFTAAPQFESLAREQFTEHSRVFLVVNMPPIYEGFYSDFFKSCKILFMTRSKAITGTVYSACTWTKES